MEATREFTNFDHVYQIWYNEETKKQCFHGFQPLHNPTLTPFFENTRIVKLSFSSIPARSWVGILSPKFFQKISIRFSGGINGKKIDDFLGSTNKEVISFFPQMTQQNIVLQGDNYHKDFSNLVELVLRAAGIDYDIRRKSRLLFIHPGGQRVYSNIFSNYVIARKEVYEKYVNEILKPCMKVMSDPNNSAIYEGIWQDAKYHKLKGGKKASGKYLESQFGVPYYPYHTFICERFWTIFMNMHPEISMTHYPFL